MNAMYRRATIAAGLIGAGALAVAANPCGARSSDDGQGGTASPSANKGLFSGLRQAFNKATGQGTNPPGPQPPQSGTETSKWNILGIKLGDPAEAAATAVSGNYPKAVRIDHEMRYHYRQFSTPLVVLGTQYIAGKAVTDIGRPDRPSQGAGELGDESEKVDVEYVWPSRGAVVAVQRLHIYDNSRKQNPKTLPSVDSILKALQERFGPPTVTNSEGGHSMGPGLFIGGSFPTITWIWADSPGALLGNKLHPRCPDWRAFQFSNRNDAPHIVRMDPSCGTFLTVTVETVANDYVESLKEQLVDSRALSAAFLTFGNYLQTGQESENAADKARADAVPPKL